MRENAAAAAMLTPVTNANSALLTMVATASCAGSQRLKRCAERVEVARRAALRQEVPHQHEQRDDREHVVAQRLIGGVGDEGADDLDVAQHQVDAQHRGDAERDGDVHAGKHQRQAPPPRWRSCRSIAEHGRRPSGQRRGRRDVVCGAAGHQRPEGDVRPVRDRSPPPASEPNMTTKRAGQTGTRSAPSPSNSPLVHGVQRRLIAAPDDEAEEHDAEDAGQQLGRPRTAPAEQPDQAHRPAVMLPVCTE